MPQLDIKQRLEASGLNVIDLRGELPRNGKAASRSVSKIQKITVHYDAIALTDGYDSTARQHAIARGHINRNWGTAASPIRGSGIMYCFTVDAYGNVFYNRDLDEVLWHAGAVGVDNNTTALSVMLHGSTDDHGNEQNTRSLGILLDVLTSKCPEFPAGRNDVYGHKEMPKCATACPGHYLDLVKAYREDRYPTTNENDMRGLTPIEKPYVSGSDMFITVRVDDKSRLAEFNMSESNVLPIVYTQGIQTGDVYAPTASVNASNLLTWYNQSNTTVNELKASVEALQGQIEALKKTATGLAGDLGSKQATIDSLMMEIRRLNDLLNKPKDPVTLESSLKNIIKFFVQSIRNS